MNEPLVLIVDDEPGLLELFGSLVNRLGYRTILANDGSKALDVLQHETPDLLILDIAMAPINGFAVLRYVHDAPHLSQMRIMVLTATGPPPSPERLAVLVDKWVTKPIQLAEFQHLVEALVEKNA